MAARLATLLMALLPAAPDPGNETHRQLICGGDTPVSGPSPCKPLRTPRLFAPSPRILWGNRLTGGGNTIRTLVAASLRSSSPAAAFPFRKRSDPVARGTSGSNPCTLQSGHWLVGIVDWPNRAGLPGVACESCVLSTSNGPAPRQVGRDGSPVGGCASSASTGIDARCGGPDVSDARGGPEHGGRG
jgi:hypothetical protein